MTIHQLISSPERWTQGVDARDKDGCSVNISNVDYFDPPHIKDIQSFSLYGAVTMLYPPEKSRDKRQKTMFGLRKAIREHTGKDMAVAQFNDDHTTKFEDVQRVLAIFKKQ